MRNKSFLILLTIAAAMTFGVMAENTAPVTAPTKSADETGADDINAKIRAAGLIPHDARYWKEID